MKKLKIFLLAGMLMLFTTYANAINMAPIISYLLSDTVTATPQEIAIDKIKAYADNEANPVPTLQDYSDAGVTGVTADNIDDVNDLVASLTASEVDTLVEIQSVIDNATPLADAGGDQTIATTATVILDGSGSSPANAGPLTYIWSMASKPEGSTAVLSSTITANPEFTADKDGYYELSLVVDNGTLSSVEDTVTIIATVPTVEYTGIPIPPTPPIAPTL